MSNIARNAHDFYYPRLDAENLRNVPGILKRCSTWVDWKEAQPDKPGGKWKKIPVNPRTGKNAKSNQPSTGGTFDEALAYFVDNPQMRGIGLILSADNEVCGIDADHCIDLETGAIDTPTADLIRLVDSYAEISHSGDGVHIMVMAKLGSGCKFTFNGRTYEIYDHGKVLAFTGTHIPNTALACWDRQQIIDSLLPESSRAAAPRFTPKPRAEDPLAAEVDDIGDAELIRLIEESDQAEKFKALMAGSTSGYAGYFPATGALCAILAAWSRSHAERIDRIARSSGLIAGWEKWWDERYGDGRTRGERTIAAACALASAGWMYAPPTDFIVNDNGSVKPLLANAITKLWTAPEFANVLAFDEFSLYTVTRKPAPWQKSAANWTDYDDIRLSEWLQRNGILVNRQIAGEAAQAVARSNPYHPVREYLSGLKWDRVERIDDWLTTYLGATATLYTKAVGPRYLISGIARIYQPGSRVDHTLILEGPQGKRKSTALATLAGPEWFADSLSDLASKDARMELHGVWIFELAELASIRRSEIDRVKSFLSSTTDHFRPPYARRAEHIPRSNIFAGSVNDASYLSDESGGRRFWPVECGTIKIDDLKRDRDMLWAEALVRYDNGNGIWWLETAELDTLAKEQQEGRYEPGVWDNQIVEWISDPTPRQEYDEASKNKIPIEKPWNSGPGYVTVIDVLVHAIGKRFDLCTQLDRNVVSKCLKHEGWKPCRLPPIERSDKPDEKSDKRKRPAGFKKPASDHV